MCSCHSTTSFWVVWLSFLEDVHSHWRFKKTAQKSINIDSLLHVQDSNIVRSREQLVEAKNRVFAATNAATNRIRREEIFDNFTLRKSSQFECVQQKMIESMNKNLDEDVTRMLVRVDSTSRRCERSRESEIARDKENWEDRKSRKNRENREKVREDRERLRDDDED